jgi:hypothetical protein
MVGRGFFVPEGPDDRSLYFCNLVCRLWAYLSLLNVAATTSDSLVLASWLGSFVQASLQKAEFH